MKQLCGSSRFRRLFRGAGSVCGESDGGGGILLLLFNNFGKNKFLNMFAAAVAATV